MDNSNTVQVPATHVSLADEQAATEPSRLPEKVILVPPSASHLARHPALSLSPLIYWVATHTD